MSKMEYLKDMPVAVLGGGAVGKTCAADIKLAGREVRLYDVMPFAEKSLKDLDKTGILFDGIQRNRDCFERSGRAFIDVVTTDIEKAIKGAGHIVVSCGSWGHEAMFRAMIPYLEDVGIHGVSSLVVAAEDHAPVFHRRNAEDRCRNMDDGVDIGEVNIKDGVGLGGTVAVRDGIHARQILRSLEEIVRVGHGQGRAAQRDGAVLGAHVREHALADALKR